MMTELLKLIKNSKTPIQSIYLHMQTSNEAGLKFYARCGFEIVKKIENYYEDITPPDSYLMKLQLNPSNQ